MSIYHYITRPQLQHLCRTDRQYLNRKLETNCLLNHLLRKPINRLLLTELRCILDSKPVPRRKAEHRNGKVVVYKLSAEVMEKLWK